MSFVETLNPAQRAEVLSFETAILNGVENLFPKFHWIIKKNKAFTSNIDRFEEMICPFMNEQGLVNGKSLNDVLIHKEDFLSQLLSFPEEDFRLVDVTNELLQVLQNIIGGIF